MCPPNVHFRNVSPPNVHLGMCILGMCATYNVHFMNVSISCEKQEKYKKQNLEQGRSYIKMCPKYNSYL